MWTGARYAKRHHYRHPFFSPKFAAAEVKPSAAAFIKMQAGTGIKFGLFDSDPCPCCVKGAVTKGRPPWDSLPDFLITCLLPDSISDECCEKDKETIENDKKYGKNYPPTRVVSIKKL